MKIFFSHSITYYLLVQLTKLLHTNIHDYRVSYNILY